VVVLLRDKGRGKGRDSKLEEVVVGGRGRRKRARGEKVDRCVKMSHMCILAVDKRVNLPDISTMPVSQVDERAYAITHQFLDYVYILILSQAITQFPTPISFVQHERDPSGCRTSQPTPDASMPQQPSPRSTLYTRQEYPTSPNQGRRRQTDPIALLCQNEIEGDKRKDNRNISTNGVLENKARGSAP
jgi:hypothetical protein